METFSRMVVVVLVVFVIYIAPLEELSIQHNRHVQAYVSAETTKFVDDVRLQGKITQNMYNDYVTRLNDAGILFDVELIHSHKSVVPVLDSVTGNVIGTKDYTGCEYESDILYDVYNRNSLTAEETAAGECIGEHRFKQGDYFTVLIRNRDVTFQQQLLANFGFGYSDASVYFQYGGMIRDENF